MVMKNYIIFLLFPLFLLSCENSGNGKVKKFKNMFIYDETMPVVNYNIGRNSANFIIDTGSDISIIDDDYYIKNMNYFNFIEHSVSSINTVSGTVSQGVIVTNALLNDSIRTIFYVTDIDNVKKDVFIKTGRQVDGILGCDFLYENKALIDFNKKELRN